MHYFLATLRRSSGVTTLISRTTLVIAVLGGAVVSLGLIGRIEKLESDLKSLRAWPSNSASRASGLNDSCMGRDHRGPGGMAAGTLSRVARVGGEDGCCR